MCECMMNDCLDCELQRFVEYRPETVGIVENEAIDELVHSLFFDDEYLGDTRDY